MAVANLHAVTILGDGISMEVTWRLPAGESWGVPDGPVTPVGDFNTQSILRLNSSDINPYVSDNPSATTIEIRVSQTLSNRSYVVSGQDIIATMRPTRNGQAAFPSPGITVPLGTYNDGPLIVADATYPAITATFSGASPTLGGHTLGSVAAGSTVTVTNGSQVDIGGFGASPLVPAVPSRLTFTQQATWSRVGANLVATAFHWNYGGSFVSDPADAVYFGRGLPTSSPGGMLNSTYRVATGANAQWIDGFGPSLSTGVNFSLFAFAVVGDRWIGTDGAVIDNAEQYNIFDIVFRHRPNNINPGYAYYHAFSVDPLSRADAVPHEGHGRTVTAAYVDVVGQASRLRVPRAILGDSGSIVLNQHGDAVPDSGIFDPATMIGLYPLTIPPPINTDAKRLAMRTNLEGGVKPESLLSFDRLTMSWHEPGYIADRDGGPSEDATFRRPSIALIGTTLTTRQSVTSGAAATVSIAAVTWGDGEVGTTTSVGSIILPAERLWAVESSSQFNVALQGVPPGMSLTYDAVTSSVVLTGTPTAPGRYMVRPVVIHGTPGQGYTTSRVLNTPAIIDVHAAGAPVFTQTPPGDLLTIGATDDFRDSVAQPSRYFCFKANTPISSLSIPGLPAGLTARVDSIDPTYVHITGTYTGAAINDLPLTIQITSPGGSATYDLELTVTSGIVGLYAAPINSDIFGASPPTYPIGGNSYWAIRVPPIERGTVLPELKTISPTYRSFAGGVDQGTSTGYGVAPRPAVEILDSSGTVDPSPLVDLVDPLNNGTWIMSLADTSIAGVGPRRAGIRITRDLGGGNIQSGVSDFVYEIVEPGQPRIFKDISATRSLLTNDDGVALLPFILEIAPGAVWPASLSVALTSVLRLYEPGESAIEDNQQQVRILPSSTIPQSIYSGEFGAGFEDIAFALPQTGFSYLHFIINRNAGQASTASPAGAGVSTLDLRVEWGDVDPVTFAFSRSSGVTVRVARTNAAPQVAVPVAPVSLAREPGATVVLAAVTNSNAITYHIQPDIIPGVSVEVDPGGMSVIARVTDPGLLPDTVDAFDLTLRNSRGTVTATVPGIVAVSIEEPPPPATIPPALTGLQLLVGSGLVIAAYVDVAGAQLAASIYTGPHTPPATHQAVLDGDQVVAVASSALGFNTLGPVTYSPAVGLGGITAYVSALGQDGAESGVRVVRVGSGGSTRLRARA